MEEKKTSYIFNLLYVLVAWRQLGYLLRKENFEKMDTTEISN